MISTRIYACLAACLRLSAAVFVLAHCGGARAQSYQPVASLDATDGSNPAGGVIEDDAGNLYGLAQWGGDNNGGTVYRIRPHGKVERLYSFSGIFGPHTPYGGLILDGNGMLIGTASLGGDGACGAVFSVSPKSGHFKPIYQFPADTLADGCSPGAGVTQTAQGKLVGTTFFGGPADFGTIFSIGSDGSEAVLHAFLGGTDGAFPNTALVADARGNLYGTTLNGGAADAGTVFKLTPDGTETVLYSFTGGADGSGPTGVFADAAGNVFGTASSGGACQLCGTVFEITAAGTEKTLYSFRQHRHGGYPAPGGGVIEDASGNLYGTTTNNGAHYAGYVFKLTPGGSLTRIHVFKRGNDGNDPMAPLYQDGAGNIFGTTYYGGKFDHGVGLVFKVTP